MDFNHLQECPNLVTWTLSGKYDPHQPILIDATNPSRFVSRAKAEKLVACLTGAFSAESTVCLHLANDVLYPVLVLAILASKCRWTGTNTAYTAAELEHHFRTSNAKYVVTAEEHLETVQTAVKASCTQAEIIIFSDLLHAVVLGSGTSLESAHSLRSLSSLIHEQDTSIFFDAAQDICPDSIAALMQTSGTTGLPKMAARTHRSMVIEQQTIEDNNFDKPYEVRRLYCTPIFHGFACPEMIFNVLRLGQTSYFMRRFDDTFAQKIHDFDITETFGAPPMLLRLVNKSECYPLLQSLRLISFGGAPLLPELRQRTLAMFKTAPRIVPVYGMTEGGWFTTLKYPEVDETGSVGRPIPGYEVKILPEHKTELNDGQPVGEILVKGPQLMAGYLGDTKTTEETLQNGWLKTGDIGYLRDGRVHLVDRSKDLMKVNGWQVAPAELENALLQSQEVLDAAVFGVGEGVEEHPMACVVSTGPNVTASAIKDHLRVRLAGYKVNSCEIKFVKVVPRNPAGKILKQVLRRQLLG